MIRTQLLPAFLVLALGSHGLADESGPISIRVSDEVANPVAPELFGQFLERATWGEPGPESAYVDEPPYLPAPVMHELERMNIPLIRFPGGTDIDYIDWRDLIDNVPGRPGDTRPVTTGYKGGTITNQFGYDEYFAVRDELHCKTMLVLNFLDAAARRKPLREAALEAAGLVAYANTPQGADLPEGMTDWPAVRARNGHPEPFGAESVQIGNELWHKPKKELIEKALPDLSDEERAAWIAECVREYVRAIRAVDPDITIAIDDDCVFDAQEVYLRDPVVRAEVAMTTFHIYAPWQADIIRIGDAEVPPAQLSDDEWWAAWTTMPGRYSDAGLADGLTKKAAAALALGYRGGCTEWNWNGWFHGEIDPAPTVQFDVASGLGSAAFLHNLMRNGDQIDLATQSMLVGSSWGITAIRVDPTGETPPYVLPQGQATGFYSRHHGDRRLVTATTNVPIPTIETDDHPPTPQGALIDAVATRDDERLYVHVIHRRLREASAVRLDLSAFETVGSTATLRTLVGDPFLKSADRGPTAVFEESSSEIATDEPIVLPPASISVLEIALAADGGD